MRITTPLAILAERNPEDFNNPEQFSDNPMAQSQTVWFEEGGNACAMYTALQDTALPAPGEKVSFGEFNLFHFADGTIRVEGPDNLRVANPKYADARYWLELAPNGQYSSHRFDPANPPAPITDPAAHFAPFVEPGMTYCNYFRAKSGTYVVSASDPDGCHPAPSLIQRFVYEDHEETATYVG